MCSAGRAKNIYAYINCVIAPHLLAGHVTETRFISTEVVRETEYKASHNKRIPFKPLCRQIIHNDHIYTPSE